MSDNFLNENVAKVVLNCVYCAETPEDTFGKLRYRAQFKDYKGYTIYKALDNPISLGLHLFGLGSYKGKLTLTYISPI